LIKTYVKQAVKRSACGYACSDHASWTQGGFKAAMPAEAAFEHTNPAIHKASDTMEKLSLPHMSDYAKLGLAFAGELANPLN
jgi:leucyl aminopeptidase